MRLICLCLTLFVISFGVNGSLSAANDSQQPLAPQMSDFTERVSINSDGSQANNESERPDISDDGRYVVFASEASDLVSGDDNGDKDIFVHDRETGVTRRVSVRSNGNEANGDSFTPAISGDGRVVVFSSLASNLVSDDDNGQADIFAHELDSGDTELINVVLNGAANDDSSDPDISTNGQYVVFTSSANNLVGGDNNFVDDVFRWDREGETMERISVDSNEVEGNFHSGPAVISGDGQRIAFESDATNLIPGDSNNDPDIFMRDRNDGTTIRVSVNSDGNQSNGDSWDPAIAAGGNYIVFASLASNLVDDDDNDYADVFLHNLDTDNTRLVSLATDGSQGNEWSEEPTVSGDGRYVAFQSYASNFVSGDVEDTRDIFIRDRNNNTLIRASNSSETSGGNGSSREPALAANGGVVAYSSKATDLVVGDTNDERDIFVTDFIGPPTLAVDNTRGAPGSYFRLAGENWVPNQQAEVWLNNSLLGTVTADGDGDLDFQLISTDDTDQGAYVATVRQNENEETITFWITVWAPLRPGSGLGLFIPDGIALDQINFLPVISR